jgi:hypothetical protein
MALDPSPHGSVFLSASRAPEGQSLGWVGRIRGDGALLWRGSTRKTRSAAYHDLQKANRDNKFKAKLMKPIPDDAE